MEADSVRADVGTLIFCSSCDYAMDKLDRDSLRCRPDAVTCPRCHAVNMTQFYSYGSQTHRDRRAAWERGEIKGAPLPFPNAGAVPRRGSDVGTSPLLAVSESGDK
jgi:phage FluMu protein Com